MEDLKTIEITLESKDIIQFQYPKAEEEMILSVLNGNDYPLSNIRKIGVNPIIIDFGSNYGSSIIYFKDNFPDSIIYGFEPSEKTYIVLKKNVQSLDNVKVEKLAVWNKKGKYKLHYGPKNLSGSYSLREWNEDLGGEYVQTTTYLHIIESNKISEIDILKIDIESVELDVLFDIFTNCSDVPINNIFIEYHGEVVLNELKETFSVIYEIIHCNEVSKSQGSVLMTLK